MCGTNEGKEGKETIRRRENVRGDRHRWFRFLIRVIVRYTPGRLLRGNGNEGKRKKVGYPVFIIYILDKPLLK